MLEKMKRFFVEEDGQGLSEYALILAGIVIVAVAVVAILTGSLTDLFNEIKAKLDAAI